MLSLNDYTFSLKDSQIKKNDLSLFKQNGFLIKKSLFSKSEILEYVQDYDPSHYKITPYNYRPETAMKLTSNSHHDLGQGIIDQVYEIEKKTKEKNI